MIKIVIKDVEYTLDEAKALYEELATLFDKPTHWQPKQPLYVPNTPPFPDPWYPIVTTRPGTAGWKISPLPSMTTDHANKTAHPPSEWSSK